MPNLIHYLWILQDYIYLKFRQVLYISNQYDL
nr:MAG TPA: hypothetical protein [Crassvirales sp.]